MTSLTRLLLSLSFLTAAPVIAQESEAPRLESFPDLRQTVTELMSSATKRLWVVTHYLTDGDIVSALYIAKYRKIDVQVLLGRAKANAYMSRLSYLKAQNIPVFLKPESFKPQATTAILADDVLLFIHADLDFLSRARDFKVTRGTDVDRDAFVGGFTEALAMKMPATARQIPLVGRPAKGHPQERPFPAAVSQLPSGDPPLPQSTSRSQGLPPRHAHPHEAKTNDPSGVYHYKRSADPRPSDVPSRLPKGLKWDKQATREKTMIIKPEVPAKSVDGG